MSTYIEEGRRTFTAGADLSSIQYIVVKYGTWPNVVAATSVSDKFLGVVTNKPTSGDLASVRLKNSDGTGLITTGAAVSVGDYLTVDSSGRGVTSSTSTDHIFGMAMEASTGVGQIIEYFCLDGQQGGA